MTKRIIRLLCAALLCLACTLPAFADVRSPRLVDNADLLSNSDFTYVKETLDEISERLEFDIVVVTVDSVGSKSPREYADDYYDGHGYGFGSEHDGILLLVSMEERDWYISTCGYGITAFTDSGIDHLGEEVVLYLSDAMYDDAFIAFAEFSEKFVTQARTGEPYDGDFMPKEDFEPLITLFLCLAAAFIIALIVTSVMRAKLKSVARQIRASQYVRPGSMNVTCANEFFLYRTLTRVPRPKESSSSGSSGSSSHRSSSGRSHGGGGGKF